MHQLAQSAITRCSLLLSLPPKKKKSFSQKKKKVQEEKTHVPFFFVVVSFLFPLNLTRRNSWHYAPP